MSQEPIIGKTDEGVILTPEKLKKQELSMRINRMCQEYGYMLVPVVQILGSNMTTSVELAKIAPPEEQLAPAGSGPISGNTKENGD